MERGAVEGPVDCVIRDDVVQALNEMKTENTQDLKMCHWSWMPLAEKQEFK